jgi:hypothetical protein
MFIAFLAHTLSIFASKHSLVIAFPAFLLQLLSMQVLAEEVAKDPHDLRSTVYLARTLSLLGNNTGAFAMYDHLQQFTKDPEEAYQYVYSCMRYRCMC